MSEVKRYEWTRNGMRVYASPMGRYVQTSDYDATQSELAALREELERQKRYMEINANSAHGKHKEGQAYKDERDALREELAECKTQKAWWVDSAKTLDERLTAAERRNADCEAKGIERAAKLVQERLDEYVRDHGVYDSDTGTLEFPGDGAEYVEELDCIASFIRALKPAESGASE